MLQVVVLRGKAGAAGVREAGVHVGVWRRAGPGCAGVEGVGDEAGEAGAKHSGPRLQSGARSGF